MVEERERKRDEAKKAAAFDEDMEVVRRQLEATAKTFGSSGESPDAKHMVIDKMLVHEPTRYRIPDGDVDYHDLLAAPDPLLPAAASG